MTAMTSGDSLMRWLVGLLGSLGAVALAAPAQANELPY